MEEGCEASLADPRGRDRRGSLLMRAAACLRRPLRIAAGLLLVAGGIFGFLPILGFWMVPLGLSLLAPDVPAAARLVRWARRKLPGMLRETRTRGDRAPDIETEAPD